MTLLTTHVQAHRRLLVCAAFGLISAFFWPGDVQWLVRALLGWNVLTWTYLVWVAISLSYADDSHIKQVALAQAESTKIVLGTVVVAAIVSLIAVAFEMRAAKAAGPNQMLPHVAFAFCTVAGSWLLLGTLFTLSYASTYYGAEPDRGVRFPQAPLGFEPNHLDFLYFSFTIAVASQTSDVEVTTREMRRLVLIQSVLSFAFNTTILALSINGAAGFF